MASSPDREEGSELHQALRRALMPPKLAQQDEPEPTSQFSFSLRKSLRTELSIRASESDITMRGLVLLALREYGLSVTDEDLVDRRKEPTK